VGQTTVSGDAYLETRFQYSYSHLWRNLGILLGFWVFFLLTYIAAAEFNVSTSHSMEELMFPRGHAPKYISKETPSRIHRVMYGNEKTIRKELQHILISFFIGGICDMKLILKEREEYYLMTCPDWQDQAVSLLSWEYLELVKQHFLMHLRKDSPWELLAEISS
jgi:hypothetical protein